MSDEELVVVDQQSAGEWRQFLAGLLLGALLIALAWAALVAGQLGQPHPHNQWVEQSYEVKAARADALGETPRVLVVAGSNALFGMDTPLLSELLHRPAVNLGVNAGIGVPYLIAHSRDLVRAGDLVLLPLEYSLYLYHRDLNQVFLDYLLSHPDELADEPWHFWLRVLWYTPLQRVWQGYQGLPEGFRPSGLYGPDNLDEHGDQRHAALADRTPELYEGALHSRPERHGALFRPDGVGWQLWREFAQTLTARGACVVFLPPAMLDRPEYHDDPVERRFYTELPGHARRMGMRFMGDPRDFLYPPEWFFDTNYHLAEEYRAVHTRALAALARQAERECGNDDEHWRGVSFR